MDNLRTAEEMYKYCIDNHLGVGFSKSWSIKHFQLIVNNLQIGESVYCVFIGLHNYTGYSKHNNYYAYAITNRRIIMGQQRVFGAYVQSINIENINDITMKKSGVLGLGLGIICIDSYKETFNVGVNNNFVHNYYKRINEAWNTAQYSRSNLTSSHKLDKESAERSSVLQLKDMKELLDMGIISQAEFEKKKKDILGL